MGVECKVQRKARGVVDLILRVANLLHPEYPTTEVSKFLSRQASPQRSRRDAKNAKFGILLYFAALALCASHSNLVAALPRERSSVLTLSMVVVTRLGADQYRIKRSFGNFVDTLDGQIGSFDERFQFEVSAPAQPASERV
jgi:hypothetical protein